MDELLEIFVENYFTEELKSEIQRSFNLFDFYNYVQAYTGFVDIINDQSQQDNDTMRDRFILEVHKKLDFLLEQHTIIMNSEADIFEKNEVLLALAHIQRLEDYTGIIRLLESLEPDEVQFSEIISELSQLVPEKILLIVESFSPTLLKNLKQFIYSKENEEVEEPNIPLIENMKFFVKRYGENNVGAQMFGFNTILGEKFSTYLPYIEKELVGDDDQQTALNILSVIYMSLEGYNSPLLVFRKYSYRLLQDLNRVSRVETKLLNIIADFTDYKKVEVEKLKLQNLQENKS